MGGALVDGGDGVRFAGKPAVRPGEQGEQSRNQQDSSGQRDNPIGRAPPRRGRKAERLVQFVALVKASHPLRSARPPSCEAPQRINRLGRAIVGARQESVEEKILPALQFQLLAGPGRLAQAVKPFAGGLVIFVEREARACVGFNRLGPVALFLIGKTQPGPAVGVVSVDIEGGVEVFDRRVIFADRDVTLASRLIGRAGERIAVDGVVEVGDRVGVCSPWRW